MPDRSPHADRPDIVTERLRLRRPNGGDVEAIVRGVGNWEVARRLARVPHPYGAADATFFLDHVVPAEWVWAITIGDRDVMVGAVGLTPEGRDTAELGYWLARDHWGCGIASEAAAAVVAYGFDVLGFDHLTSGFFDDNPASGRVLARLGFVETGRTRRACLAVGAELPSVRMRLLARERPSLPVGEA